jgi:hypothetical protein
MFGIKYYADLEINFESNENRLDDLQCETI